MNLFVKWSKHGSKKNDTFGLSIVYWYIKYKFKGILCNLCMYLYHILKEKYFLDRYFINKIIVIVAK